MRGILSSLAGNEDYVPNQYLYRFKLPSLSNGAARIYTLGAKGKKYLLKQMGVPAYWHFKHDKMRFGDTQADHNLSLSRYLICLQAWAKQQPNYRIAHIRICYELGKTAPLIEVAAQGITEKLKVIPDAWVLVEKLSNGTQDRHIPCWIELDRSTQHLQRFTQQTRSKIAFIQSGAYKDFFHTNAVLICYVVTGQTDHHWHTRRIAISRYIMEVLKELNKENWATIFRITSTNYQDMYQTPFFDPHQPIWYRPDSPMPVTLFTP